MLEKRMHADFLQDLHYPYYISSGRDIHNRHLNQLPHYVRERSRRSGIRPWENCPALLARVVCHRPCRRHPLRPTSLRNRHRRSEPPLPRTHSPTHMISSHT